MTLEKSFGDLSNEKHPGGFYPWFSEKVSAFYSHFSTAKKWKSEKMRGREEESKRGEKGQKERAKERRRDRRREVESDRDRKR